MPRQAYLECFTGARTAPKRFELTEFPARIGRQPGCAVQLNVARISRVHAEIRRDEYGYLVIADLGSTNGTFVNGRRLEASARIISGDVIHVGDQEMRLVEEQAEAAPAHDEMTQIGLGTLPHEFPTMVREFNEHGFVAVARPLCPELELVHLRERGRRDDGAVAVVVLVVD